MPGRIVLSKPSKYRNKKCEYDGHKFDSQKERDRYIVLKAMEKAGKIHNLHHDREVCTIEVEGANHIFVCKYIADFRYIEIANGESRVVYEDVKSPPTRRKEVYRLKKKLLAAMGIEILET